MLRVAKMLARQWPGVTVTLVDRQDIVTQETREAFRRIGWSVRTEAADVFDYLQADGGGADIVTANLFLHHFAEEELVAHVLADCGAGAGVRRVRAEAVGYGSARLPDALGDRLQRREPARCGGERASRVFGQGAVGAVAGVRMGAERARCGAIHALLRRAGARMTRAYDAIVIGGGPAGAASAILLAKAGWNVAVVEKAKFPRRKVCGEFISATNAALLDELGVGETFRALAGPEVRRVGLFARDVELTGAMPRADGGWGRALGRERLDGVLLERAASLGADIRQPWAATALRRTADGWACDIAASDRRTETLGAPDHRCGAWVVGARRSTDAGQARASPVRSAGVQGAFSRVVAAGRRDAAARVSGRLWRHGA